MTAETKDFPLGVVLSLTSGFMLADNFGQIHEAAEWLMGHSIWSHEFADKALADRLRGMVLAQRPQLAEADHFVAQTHGLKDVGNSAARSHVDSFITTQVERFGPVVSLAKGQADRTESPLESLERIAPGKAAVVVVK